MTGIVINSFRGKVPRRSTRLLNDTQAVVATNCVLTDGKLAPVNRPGLVHTSLAASIASLYRYEFGAEINWLSSANVVDYAKSSVAQDALGRIYYTGDGEPRMSTYASAISGGGPYPAGWFVLGVTPPVTAAGLVVTGGGAPVEARAYVYTFVTQFGEESGPSPATLATGNVNGSWGLSLLDAAPPNNGTLSGALANTPSAGLVRVAFNATFGLVAGEYVSIAGVTGMTDLNGRNKVVSVTGLNVVVALATAQTYTSGGTWTREAPHNTAGMLKRIYRTVGNSVDYKFVAEIAVATTTYSDVIAVTALAESIPSLYTLQPPKEGHSLRALANGAYAMLVLNELCMSEPYKPHSWPLANRYSFPAKCVTLSSAQNAVIVLTNGFPIFVTATVPEAASVTPGDAYAPCVSKRGVAHTGDGCLYPGHDGLYAATASGARNITLALYRSKKEWAALYPETFRAALNSLGYYAAHQNASGQQDSIWFLDAAEPDSVVDYDEAAGILYANELDGNLYLANGNKVSMWGGDTANRKMLTWQSKDFQTPYPLNFAAAQVKARYADIVPINPAVLAANTALLANADNVDGEIATAEVLIYEVCGSALLAAPQQTQGVLQFTLLRNGQPIYTRGLTHGRPFTLPNGFVDDVYALHVAANIPVDALYVAQAMDELGQAT